MNTEKILYIPIDLSVLRIDEVNPFNFYLKTGPVNNEYVLYSKKGSRFTEKLQMELISNGVKIIYVPDTDREVYLEYIEWNLQDIINDKSINPEEKSKIVYNSSKHLFTKLFYEPRIETILRTKKTINHLVDIIISDPKTTGHLIRITEHDYATYTHSINVGILSLAFVKDILKNISVKEFYNLGSGFFLHDIGKTLIPLDILNKKGPLGFNDWMLMKTHPQKGYKMLKQAGVINEEASTIVLQHHERTDGSGYPKGLKGDEINIFGKICSIVDSFDAMTTNRYYQPALSSFEAMNIIKEKMQNKKFDEDIFKKFVTFFSEK